MELDKEDKAKASQKVLERLKNGNISFDIKLKNVPESEKMLFKTSKQQALLESIIQSKDFQDFIENKLKSNLIVQQTLNF
jgi:hypothetical protein